MEELVIDLSELTWGELEEIEKHAGVEAALNLMDGKVQPSATVVLLWIIQRRKEASFTLEDARRLPINTPLRVENAENPTAAGA
jgi:hypothetical protein